MFIGKMHLLKLGSVAAHFEEIVLSNEPLKYDRKLDLSNIRN